MFFNNIKKTKDRKAKVKEPIYPNNMYYAMHNTYTPLLFVNIWKYKQGVSKEISHILWE